MRNKKWKNYSYFSVPNWGCYRVGDEDLDSAISRGSLTRSPDECSERGVGDEDLDSAVSRESLTRSPDECSERGVGDGD